MSDSEDNNSRRAARPSTPPFRGPAGPAARPPLTPPASPAAIGPAKGPQRPPSAAPFALPPAGAKPRPATPAQGARRPAPTPPGPAAAPPAARQPAVTPIRPRTPRETEIAAIPAYGSAPPPSVAATLKSISEFTIVEEPAPTETSAIGPSASAPSAEQDQGTAGYEAPTITAHAGTPGAAEAVEEAAAGEHGGADPVQPGADLDSLVTVPPFEADELFDASPSSEVTLPFLVDASGAEPEADPLPAEASASDPEEPSRLADDGETETVEALFGSPRASDPEDPDTAYEPEPERQHQPVFIGGDPSTRFVAENLEEIARGIRAGEIVLPRIDPSAGQPAVLAAVLAAILAPR